MRQKARHRKLQTFLKKATIIVVGVLFVVAFTARKDQALAAEGINNQINYQGKLLTSSSVPVSSGTYSLEFSLYDAESGGNRIWTAAGTVASPSAVNVDVTTDGLFSVLLGSGAQNTLDSVDWNSDSVYLGVTVGSDSEMTPRKRFGSVAQAFNAEAWNGYYTSTSTLSGAEVLKLVQTSADAASSARSVFVLSTSGTSETNDYLFQAFNSSGAVFTISRSGHTTTTGNFHSQGTTILGNGSSDSLVINAGLNSNLLPLTTDSFDLGSPSQSFQDIYASGTSSILRGINFTFATGTSATTTNFATTNLLVGGQSVCLEDGTNCILSSESDTLLTVTNRGSVATSTLTLYGGVTTSDLTATGTTDLQGDTTFVDATGTSLEVTGLVQVGAIISSGSTFGDFGGFPTNALFSTTDESAWVHVYKNDMDSTTNGFGHYITNAGEWEFWQTSSTSFMGYLPPETITYLSGIVPAAYGAADTRGYFYVETSIHPRQVSSSNTYDLGASGIAWRNIYASGTTALAELTFDNATATTLVLTGNLSAASTTLTTLNFSYATGTSIDVTGDVRVAGLSVCLADGTNCSAGSQTWEETLRQGNTATSSFITYGNGTTTNFHATGTLTVDGGTTLANATATSLFTTYGEATRLLATNATFTQLAVTSIQSDLTPATNTTFDLGSVTNSWKDIYASGTLYVTNGVINGSLQQGTGIDILNSITHTGRREIFAGNNGSGQSAAVHNAWITEVASSTYTHGYGAQAFHGGVFDGEHVWLSPFRAANFVKLDPATGVSTTIPNIYAGTASFSGAVFDGKRIWFPSQNNSNAIIAIDPSTNATTTYTHAFGSLAFSGGTFDGTYIWLAPYNSDYIMRIEPETGASTTYAHGYGNAAFRGAVFDGENVWLVPFIASDLVKIDPSTGTLTAYPHSYGTAAFSGGVFDGQNIWLVPSNSDYLVKVNPATGAFTEYTHGYGVTAAFSGGVFDGQSIWLAPSNSPNIVKFDPSTGASTTFAHGQGTGAFDGAVFDGESIWFIPYGASSLLRVRSPELGLASLYTPGTLSVGATSTFNGALTAASNTAFDIGSAVNSWKNIYASGTIYAGSDVVVNGLSVCLSDGTNCQALGGGGAGAFTYNGTSNIVYNVTSTSDIAFGGTDHITSPYYFRIDSTSSRFLIGANGSSTDVVIGASTSSISNSAFQLDGNDLFIAGNIGSASSVYTNGAFVAGSGTTFFGDGFITKTNGDLILGANAIIPSANNAVDFGTATSSFKNIYASGTVYVTNLVVSSPTEETTLLNFTFTNTTGTSATTTDFYATNLFFAGATGTNLEISDNLTVSGLAVCLSSGTNCPSGLSTPTWENVLAQGNTATSSFITYGNGTTTNFHATGTLTVDGGTTLANATATSLFTAYGEATRLLATNATFTQLAVTSIQSDLTPATSNTFDLGSGSSAWKDIYASGTLYVTNGVFNGSITQSSGINILNSITHTGRREIFAGNNGFGQGAAVQNTWLPFTSSTVDYAHNYPDGAFAGGVFDGENIWLAPYSATSVVRLNPATGQTTDYSHSYGSTAFSGAVFDGKNVWLIPLASDYIVKVDPDTGAFTDYAHGYGNNLFRSGVFDGERIWMAPFSAEYLVEFDPETGTITEHPRIAGTLAYAGSAYDGQNIWFAPYYADDFMKLDPTTGATTTFPNAYGNEAFYGSVFDGQNVWMIPYSASALLKINPTTNAITAYAHGDVPNNAFIGGVFDGQSLWLVPEDAANITRVNPDTGAMTSYAHSYGASAFRGAVFDGENIWMIPNASDYIVKLRPSEFGRESLYTAGVLNVGATSTFGGNLLPSQTDTLNLGSALYSWQNIYASGTAYVGTDVVVGGLSVCLSDGTNCSASGSQTWQQTLAEGNVATSSFLTYGNGTTTNFSATGTLIGKILSVDPEGTQTITSSSTTINANGYSHYELNADADYVMISTPTIPDGTAGQVLFLHNESPYTITLQDELDLTGSNIVIGGADSTLRPSSTAILFFDEGEGFWFIASNPNSSVAGANASTIPVRNASGGAISAGSVVYANGFNVGQGRVTVGLADADDSSKMPAIGIMAQSVSNNGNGDVIAAGNAIGLIDTSGASVGDGVWVSTTAGEVMFTRPDTDDVQRIGIVTRSSSNGNVLVSGAGRVNDIPNVIATSTITELNLGYATATRIQVGSTTATNAFATHLLFTGATGSYANISNFVTSNATITGGSINGTTIGATTPGSAFFTNASTSQLTVSGTSTFEGRVDAYYLNRWFQDPLTARSITNGYATTSVGDTPNAIAFDGTHMWVVNSVDGNVSKIDTLTNTVTATATVGSSPWGAAFDGTSLWVTNSGDNTVSKVNIALATETTTVPVGSGPTSIAYDGRYMWVVNAGVGSVSRLDTVTESVTATTTVGSSLYAIAFDGQYMWASDVVLNSVFKIDTDTGTVVATTTVGTSPTSLAFDGQYMWVTNADDNTVSKVNVDTATVVATISVGTGPTSLVFDGTNIWVANADDNTVSKIDTNTNSIVATKPAGSGPSYLAFDGVFVWAVNASSNNVTKIPIGGGYGSAFAMQDVTFVNATGTNLDISGALRVGGQVVCLNDGTGCPSSVTGASVWTYSASEDIIRPATTTADLAIGGIDHLASPYYFRIQSTSSRFLIGANGSSTDVVIGGSTSTISNSAFQLTGDDLFVTGNIGSASSVYTNGAFVAGDGTTLYGNGFITNTTDVFTVSSTQTLVNGRLDAYELNRWFQELNLARTLNGGATTTIAVGTTESLFFDGTDIWASMTTEDSIKRINPRTGTVTAIPLSDSPNPLYSRDNIAFDGRYIWVTSDNTNDYLWKIDSYTNQVVATTTLTGATRMHSVLYDGYSIWVTASTAVGSTYLFNVSATSSEVVASSTTATFDTRSAMEFDGEYLWLLSYSNLLKVQRETLSVLQTVSVGSTGEEDMVFDGAYLWVVKYSPGRLVKVDVKTGEIVATIYGIGGNQEQGVTFDGRYIWLTDATDDYVHKIDTQTNVIVASYAYTNPADIVFDGQYVWFVSEQNLIRLPAGGSSLGSDFTLNANFVPATSTLDIGQASSSWQNIYASGTAYVGTDVVVGGLSVCLSDGTNCSASGSQTWEETLRQGNTATSSFITYGNGTTTNFHATGTFTVDGGTTLANATATSLFVTNGVFTNTTATQFAVTSLQSDLTPAANNVFDLGSASASWKDIYASGTAALAELTFDNATATTLALTGNFSAASTTLTTLNFSYATGTAIDATEDVRVGGQSVCLEDGTNCPSGLSTPTWENVLAQGNTATSSFITYGNGTTTNFHATGTLTVDGGTTLANATATSLFATNGRFTSATSTNFTTTNLLTSSIGTSSGSLSVTSSADITFTPTGNVGVGTSTPSEKLTVVGNIQNLYALGTASMELVSSITVGTNPTAVFVRGKTAYIVNAAGSISVIDVSDVLYPRTLSTFSVGTQPSDIFVDGDYAYVTDYNNGNWYVLDISDPTDLVLVDTIDLGTSGRHSIVVGGYAYVADPGTDTVVILDVSDPASARTVSTVTGITGVRDIYVDKGYLYAPSFDDDTLSIYDVSDPTNPQARGTVGLGTDPFGIFVQGSYAYVTNLTAGSLSIVDVSDPNNPSIDSTIVTGSSTYNVVVSGKYAYVESYTNQSVFVIDVASSTNPIIIDEYSLGIGPSGMFISGRYLYAPDLIGTSVNIYRLLGTEVSSLQAHSLEAGSLLVHTDASIVNNLSVGSALSVGIGGIISGGAITVTATTTPSIFMGGVSSTALSIQGTSVCLEDGTNCPSGLATPTWENVLAQGNTATSSFITYGNGTTTNFHATGTFTVDGGTTLANATATSLFVTYGQFTNATGTNLETTNLFTSTIGTISGSLTVTSTNNIVFTPTGNVGVGTSTPSEKLTVVGNIQNTLVEGQQLELVANYDVGTFAQKTVVQNGLAYTAAENSLVIADVSDPTNPNVLGSVAMASGNPIDLAVSGQYVFIPSDTTPAYLDVIDVSDPANPVQVATSSAMGNEGSYITISGNYAYIAFGASNNTYLVDISDPLNPVSGGIVVARGVTGVQAEDGVLFVADGVFEEVQRYDITDPSAPALQSTLSYDTSAIDIRDGFVYSVLATSDEFGVANYTSATQGFVVATTTVGEYPMDVVVSGRYAFVLNKGADGVAPASVSTVDISDPANPINLGETNVGTQRYGARISAHGGYLYVTNLYDHDVYILKIPGMETARLTAHAANIGTLNVLADADVSRNLFVGSTIFAGQGGIYAGGAITVTATTTPSIFLGGVSSTSVTVNGLSVCLSDGTNCQTLGSGGTGAFTYNGTSNIVYNVTSTSDIAFGGTDHITSPYYFRIDSTSSRFLIGANGSSTDVVIGGSTSTISNVGFQLDGNDLFVAGNIGSASSVYTNGAFFSGGGTTVFGDGFIRKTDGDLILDANAIVPANEFVDFGTASSSFRNIYASGTLYATNLILNSTTTETSFINYSFTNTTGTNATTTNLFSTYGQFTHATATSLHADVLCLTGDDCITSWPTGGSSFSWGVLQFPPDNDTYALGSATGSLSNIYASGTAYIGTDVVVGGESVCLADGTNCPSGLSTPTWENVLAQGNTATSSFITYGNGTTTNFHATGTLTVDGGTTLANATATSLFVTYGQFTNATGTNLETTNLFTSTIGTISGSLTVTSTNNIVFIPTGNVGVGTSTPSEKLTVVGNIQNTLVEGQQLELIGDVVMSARPSTPVIQNGLAYVVTYNTGNAHRALAIYDVSDPLYPKILGETVYAGGSPKNIAVVGDFAYVPNASTTVGTLLVFNISDPTNPFQVATSSVVGDRPLSVTISGNYAYVSSDNGSGDTAIVDISDPYNPVLVTTLGAGASDAVAEDGWLYTLDDGSNDLRLYDIRDPENPRYHSALAISSKNMDVQDRFAYLEGSDIFTIVDYTNPASPVVAATSSVPTNSDDIVVSGKYAYVMTRGQDGVEAPGVIVFDVSSSTNPINLGKTYIGSNRYGSYITVQGPYVYVANVYDADIYILRIPGMETASLIAHAAELGNVSVLADANISRNLFVGASIFAGQGGILSAGALTVTATTTPSIFMGGVSTTSATVEDLFVWNVQSDLIPDTNTAYDIGSGAYSWQNIYASGTLSIGATSTFTGGLMPTTNDFYDIGSTSLVWANVWGTTLHGSVADYAEYFMMATGTSPESGTVIAISDTYASSVTVGNTSLRRNTLGIVSPKGAFVGNSLLANATSSVLVGLMGQLDVKVNTASSSIAIGDKIMMGAEGYAVKARGPGMIIGTALEALEEGATGTVLGYISPHWWAGDLLSVSENGSVLIEDLAIASSTIASTSTQLVSSPLFSFRGTAYDESSSTVITSTFHIGNNVVSTTTARFTVSSDATSTSLLTVSEIGDVAISGRFYLSDRGTMQYDKYIFYDGSEGVGGDYIRTNASGWGTGNYDFAEMFPSTEDLEPGDVVVVDPLNPEHVIRASSANQGAIVGIVSTKPGFLAGNNEEGHFPIALSGRVPLKVTTENGNILAGDYLVASSESGRAMKAVEAGPTVGIALEAYDGTSASTTIMAYVYVGWYGGSGLEQSEGTGFARSGFARILAGDTVVHVEHESVGNYPMVIATPSGNPGNWWISGQSDIGFDIVLEAEQLADVVFSWFVTPTENGAVMWNSDSTSNDVDSLTGEAIPNPAAAAPPPEEPPPEPVAEEPPPEEPAPVVE